MVMVMSCWSSRCTQLRQALESADSFEAQVGQFELVLRANAKVDRVKSLKQELEQVMASAQGELREMQKKEMEARSESQKLRDYVRRISDLFHKCARERDAAQYQLEQLKANRQD